MACPIPRDMPVTKAVLLAINAVPPTPFGRIVEAIKLGPFNLETEYILLFSSNLDKIQELFVSRMTNFSQILPHAVASHYVKAEFQ